MISRFLPLIFCCVIFSTDMIQARNGICRSPRCKNGSIAPVNQNTMHRNKKTRRAVKRCLQRQDDQPCVLTDVNLNCEDEYPSPSPTICYTPYTKYRKEDYCVQKCVQEACPSYRLCCRYVPEYFEQTHCRYKPEYYKTKQSRQVPEYYYECDTCYKPKYHYEKHSRYIPSTHYRQTCVQTCIQPPCTVPAYEECSVIDYPCKPPQESQRYSEAK